ncbi:MAG: UvrD-helicase domain-containing protein [Pirellulales bacterium]
MPPDLNPAQLQAVQTLRGPLLVLAGAGTGKTRVVTYRIAELIRHGTRPDRILAVTFTRKAAGEMQQRATELLVGKRRRAKDAPRPEISTFHSLCVRVLRRNIARLGYPARFTICDRGDQESHARNALREIRAPGDALRPGDLLGFIGRWKMKSIWPHQAEGAAETDREHLAAVAYRRYQTSLKSSGLVDFDDLLLLTEDLFTKFPTVRRGEAQRFDQVLIDEYQDTNHSQYEIVKALAMGHRNLCVVGDDDQSIYGWRGAEVAHILRFKHDWPEAVVVRLEANYRSTAAILQYANTLIAFNRERHEKVLRPLKPVGARPRVLQYNDETEEAKGVVFDIRQQIQQERVEPRNIAILFRTNEQPRAFEAELRATGVPYVLIGGMSFYDRREVRDLLAYLKVIHNPSDEPSLLRILNTPPRGIGDAAKKALLEDAVASGVPLWNVLPTARRLQLSETATKSVGIFHKLVESWQQREQKLTLTALVRTVIDESRYRDELARLYDDPLERESRLGAIEEIVNAAASFEGQKKGRGARGEERDGLLGGFLDAITVGERDDSEDKENQLQKNAVALMTLHSAKGLEFPHVYLVGMEEGVLPHKRSTEGGDDVDEERRLCYVGVTRAQERLTLSFALTRRKWGKPRDTQPSRFLYEMTGQAENARARQTAAKRGAARKRAT